jgi:NitT/TauT family transport system ATP-binding protein
MIKWKSLCFSYGSLNVMEDFSLEMDDPGVTVLLGPSGSGKTTLLHLAAGLRTAHKGEVENPFKDAQSYLFQKPRLLPWKSIRDNVSFALPSDMDQTLKDRKAMDTLKLVGLDDFAEYLPRELSGGMEQRAAIARAFVPEAELLMMDEPFKGLDLKMKMPLLELILEILKVRQTRTILVTHDVREAILMGDRIILLQGPPLRIRENFINPCSHEQRNMEHQAFYDLEHHLYKLILE